MATWGSAGETYICCLITAKFVINCPRVDIAYRGHCLRREKGRCSDVRVHSENSYNWRFPHRTSQGLFMVTRMYVCVSLTPCTVKDLNHVHPFKNLSVLPLDVMLLVGPLPISQKLAMNTNTVHCMRCVYMHSV